MIQSTLYLVQCREMKDIEYDNQVIDLLIPRINTKSVSFIEKIKNKCLVNIHHLNRQ